ncbi:MAG: mechanosensitive ion channel family protein, partial [Gammaproteobacteria bacterium]|nr:mechanosensitive ion channel family protein [Gammaproteobacteria bacterium]
MNKNNRAGRRRRPWIFAILMVAFLALPSVVGAQDAEPGEQAQPSEPVEPQPMPDETSAQLQNLYDAIGDRRARISKLKGLLAANGGKAEQLIYGTRLDRAWVGLLEDGDGFVHAVVDAKTSGYDLGEYLALAGQVLESQGEVGGIAWERMRQAATLPAEDLSAAEQAAAYSKLFDLQETTDRIFDTYLAGLELAEELGIDMFEDTESIKAVLSERALNVSVFLELSVDKATAIKAGAYALPEDQELKAKVLVANERVSSSAKALERIVAQMDSLGLETAEYREQVLRATGAVTTDVFDFAIIGSLLSRGWQWLLDYFVDEGPTFLFQALLFLLIIFGFYKLGKVVKNLVTRALNNPKFHLSVLLKRMLASTAGNVVLILGVLIALSQVGISLGPLLAGLGIAGFVIGFALQDTLSNFASGMMILFYRPFDVGDVVEAGGVFGKVSAMSLVNTTFLTFDNQTIILPNNMIWGGVIKNLNEQKHRRVDLVFGVSYSDDIAKVEKILNEIIDAHDKVLDDPEPIIKLHELADSSVNLVVRPWVESDDYWDVYWDLMRE